MILPPSFGAGSRVATLKSEQRQALADCLVTKLKNEFADIGSVTQETGPGTLILGSVITDFAAPSVGANVVTTLVVGPVSTGGVSVEFEAIDGASGRVIAIFRGGRTGNVVKNFSGSYSEIGHARTALTKLVELWRNQLRAPEPNQAR
jgi:hypothetical protein